MGAALIASFSDMPLEVELVMGTEIHVNVPFPVKLLSPIILYILLVFNPYFNYLYSLMTNRAHGRIILIIFNDILFYDRSQVGFPHGSNGLVHRSRDYRRTAVDGSMFVSVALHRGSKYTHSKGNPALPCPGLPLDKWLNLA